MRQTKFRAWHQELDQWVYYTTEDAFYSKVFNKDRSKWRGIKDASVLVNDSRYTGLKDKDGVEIYEGDILKQHGLEGVKPCIVEFENGGFYPLVDDFWVSHGAIEVIGNIYEHPELLESNQ